MQKLNLDATKPTLVSFDKISRITPCDPARFMH